MATNASIIFPQIQKQLTAQPDLVSNLRGLFIINVIFEKGVQSEFVKKVSKVNEEWYLLFQGKDASPIISKQKPSIPSSKIPVVLIDLNDKHLLNFVSGGLSGIKAVASGQIKIIGDLELAQKLEQVFESAGGVEKTMKFIQEWKSKL